MTTIAYRGGWMVSDSRAFSGERLPIGTKDKLFSLQDGGCVGVSSSNPGVSERLVRWLDAGSPEKDYPLEGANFVALLVSATGEVFYYKDSQFPSGPLKTDFFAIGTGAEYAMGAMAQGASAIDAVHIAIQLDVWSGGIIVA